jgi:hypothetical protein
MDQDIGPDPGESRSAVALMALAQRGDQKAYRELQRIGEAQGLSFTEGWSSQMLLFRLQDRASTVNLLSRASVEDNLAAAVHDLSDPRDGPIERLLVQRAALCLVDAGQADYEHLAMIRQAEEPWEAEVYDRRRDRAQRRLLATLKTLAEVRRLNRPAAVQVNQLSVGDGNTNIIRV